jgi:AcrR family transcriptional regulator
MQKWDQRLIDEARRLRADGETINAISASSGMPHSTVWDYVRDVPIPIMLLSQENGRSESLLSLTTKARFAKQRSRWEAEVADSEREAPIMTDLSLFFLGLGLYWGDGSKNELLPVSFTNSDPHAIAAYLAFLKKAGANLEKLSASLVIHESADLAKSKAFWGRVTGIRPERIYLTVKKYPDQQVRLLNGTLNVKIHDSDFSRKVFGWLRGLLDQFSESSDAIVHTGNAVLNSERTETFSSPAKRDPCIKRNKRGQRIDTQLIDTARRLRGEGVPLDDISNALGVAKSTLWLHVRDVEIAPDVRVIKKQVQGVRLGLRNKARHAEQRRRWNNEMDGMGAQLPKVTEATLFALGLGLYWAEGSKSESRAITLTNTDVRMIRAYLSFLRHLGADLNKLSISLIIHDDSDSEEARRYWANETGVPAARIYITKIAQTASPRKLVHGTVHLHLQDTAFSRRVFGCLRGTRRQFDHALEP